MLENENLYPGCSTCTLLGTLAHSSVPVGAAKWAASQILAVRVPVLFQDSGMGPHKPGLLKSVKPSRPGAEGKRLGSCPAGTWASCASSATCQQRRVLSVSSVRAATLEAAWALLPCLSFVAQQTTYILSIRAKKLQGWGS